MRAIRDWADRHKYKLGGAAIVAAGVAGYLWYAPEHNPFNRESSSESYGTSSSSATRAFGEGGEIAVEEDEWSSSSSRAGSSNAVELAGQRASAQRSRILLRVRKEFAVQAMQFLPLLHTKIVRVVDFDHAFDQLRELKRRRAAAEKSSNGNGAEMASTLDNNQLWEEIKDSSFTYLFVTTYIGAVMCALLRIQLHLQARAMAGASSKTEGGGAGTGASDDFFEQMDVDLLKQLVNSTYTPLFGEGLRGLTALVRSHVTVELADWPVCDPNVMVEHAQLSQKLTNIRKACEASFPALLTTMCLLPPSERENPELNEHPASGGIKPSSSATGGGGSDSLVATLLAQTWDVVDSPLFSNVCTEAVDTCFRHISLKLREKVFLPGESGGASTELRTPPIASLLPQIKAIAKEMLPAPPVPNNGTVPAKSLNGSSSSSLLTAEVRDIASGAALDSLCIALFDAPNM